MFESKRDMKRSVNTFVTCYLLIIVPYIITYISYIMTKDEDNFVARLLCPYVAYPFGVAIIPAIIIGGMLYVRRRNNKIIDEEYVGNYDYHFIKMSAIVVLITIIFCLMYTNNDARALSEYLRVQLLDGFHRQMDIEKMFLAVLIPDTGKVISMVIIYFTYSLLVISNQRFGFSRETT